ncbi:maleate cis-trans isomerase family protein [Polymorphobacter sp.]|uniref:maleate cis-trans isomerase family protein n=1 Tax=Polymorphobacter sp. TaxID=1909290 RepID=UPI003F70F826
MSLAARDYGSAGRVAVATPQANPTVEAEFGILMPRRISLHITRLQSRAPDSAGRLVDYLEKLEASVDSFDSFRPDAFGFACTGSSYLVGADREAEILAAVTARTGLVIDTATAAIRWRLDQLGARRIALLSPYPETLNAAAIAFWQAAGLTIVRTAHVAIASADTRGIYELRAADAAPALAALDLTGIDAVLVSGTGLPSLPLIADWPHALPLLSSNTCLAARLVDRLGTPDALSGWQQRLAEAR